MECAMKGHPFNRRQINCAAPFHLQRGYYWHDSVRGPISRAYATQIFLFVFATADGTLHHRKCKMI